MNDPHRPPDAAPPAPWTASARLPECPRLDQDATADVCIVGAGIAGLTTAYLLVQSGHSVVVVDDGPLASGMTARTTGHLTAVIDDRYVEIERMHGERGAQLAADSHTAAIAQIATIVEFERIACGFRRVDGFLFAASGSDPALLERELAAARRAGLSGVTRVDRAPWSTFDTGSALRFPDQAWFHPLQYLAGLAQAIQREGGRLFTRSHADAIRGGTDARVTVGSHTVFAKSIVVATNAPVNNRIAIHTKQAPYMTYAIAARVPPGVVAPALYWDTADPYHYVRLHDTGDGGDPLLVVGGEDHKTGQADDTVQRHARLETWARERVPRLGRVEYAWAGQVMETVDGVAFIGRNPMDDDNVYVCTGDSGMGLTHGTIAGILITDLIRGRANPWADLYDPARKTLRALGTFTREGLNMAAQYRDWVTAGDVASVDDVAPGSGGIVRRGLRKLAVHRDRDGRAHVFSAVCPHLGCIVHWNAAESTFDCPCHGSRFDAHGDVVNGPANRGLRPDSP